MSIQSPIFPLVDTVPETILGLTIHGLSPVLRAPANSLAESMSPLRFAKYFLSSLFSCPVYTACIIPKINEIKLQISWKILISRFHHLVENLFDTLIDLRECDAERREERREGKNLSKEIGT